MGGWGDGLALGWKMRHQKESENVADWKWGKNALFPAANNTLGG